MKYLDLFNKKLSKYQGSLIKVNFIQKIEKNAKEYLNKLAKVGKIESVCWGWYYIPGEKQDLWEFLARDKNFKVIIKQTAASFWNFDFIHRNILRSAVKDPSYKKALEEFARKRDWIFEVECHKNMEKQFEYQKNNGLFIESPESCIVNCTADWSFSDAFSVLYFRKERISLERVKKLGMWKRIARSNIRVWSAVMYGCNLFNEYSGKKIFDVQRNDLNNEEIKELIGEAVEKVMEFA